MIDPSLLLAIRESTTAPPVIVALAVFAWLLLQSGLTGREIVHNLVAHPLLVLAPPLGAWLHERTAPEGE